MAAGSSTPPTSAAGIADPAVRVAYVLTNYPHIAETFVQREIEVLTDAGAEVTRVSLNTPGPDDLLTDSARAQSAATFYVKAQPAWRSALVLAREALTHPLAVASTLLVALRCAGADLHRLLWQVFYVAEGILVQRHVARSGTRHLHAHLGGASASVTWYAAEYGRRRSRGRERWSWSVTIHGWHEFVDESSANLREKVHAAALVICISDFTRSQLMRIADPQDWDKVVVVRCGVDPTEFAYRPPAPPADPPVVLTVGRLSPEKGHLVALDAVDELRRRGRPVRWQFAGSGEMAETLAAQAASRGLAESIELLGPVARDRVPALLAAADAFVLPSFAEGLPIVYMEAMAIGTPVVGTAISGVPELLVDGVTGRTVPPGRADLIADALTATFDDPATTRTITAAARARVEQDHDLRHNAHAVMDLLTRTSRETRT